MAKADVPNEQEERILRENDLDPAKFCVIHSDKDTIVLRNYKTRDDLTIHKGDREW